MKKTPWIIPTAAWASWRPPSSLLRAEFEIIKFQSALRKTEIDDLQKWCDTKYDHSLALRLICGPGGMGKTRLAIQFAKEMQAQGWSSGFLDYTAFEPDEGEWNDLLSNSDPLLLVFDYVEHRVEELSWLLPTLAERSRTSPIRLLLLARDAGDWWTSLVSKRKVSDIISPVTSYSYPLKPLTTPGEDRTALWQYAASEFSKRLDKPIVRDSPANLQDKMFDRALLLLMDALAAVEEAAPHGADGILEYVLQREYRFWIEHLKARKLPERLLGGVKQFMAFVTWIQGIPTAEEGFQQLRSFRFFDGEPNDVLDAINQMLADCYPGSQWIEPLQPDLLGDHLMNVSCANTAFADEIQEKIIAMAGKLSRE